MQPVARPPLAEPPRMPDVIVVGAGAAGIGAARRLLSRGLTVALLEARDRVGGRAVTVPLRGHPIDLGAHWLHAGPVNPLVALGHARGEPLRRAPQVGHLIVRGRRGRRDESRLLDRAFDLADRAMTMASRHGPDRAAGEVLPPMGPWGSRVSLIHGLVSGRPLDEVSLHDFPSMEYSDNFFIAGGLGAYLARLAAGLPARLSTPVTAIDWSGPRVRVETPAGALEARALVLAVPVLVLQAGAIRFTPALPASALDALHAFTAGIYEHVVLHWPGSPFSGPDRLASLVGTRHQPPGMLTSIDGTAFHYFELDLPNAARLDGRDPHAPARFARAVLAAHFGPRALSRLSIPLATGWRHDPMARASWAVIPPGRAPAREALKRPVGERIWFAGEALSKAQWGTAGGAFAEGERAAEEIVATLASGHARRLQDSAVVRSARA